MLISEQISNLQNEIERLQQDKSKVSKTGQAIVGTYQSGVGGIQFTHNHKPVYGTYVTNNILGEVGSDYNDEEKSQINSIDAQISAKQTELNSVKDLLAVPRIQNPELAPSDPYQQQQQKPIVINIDSNQTSDGFFGGAQPQEKSNTWLLVLAALGLIAVVFH